RIGIHTGPVVAGLLGQYRFVYDVWGETVNIASRLEAHGLPGRIQLSQATLDALGLGGAQTLPVTPRGQVALKGIGGIEAYLLGA
ncbi:MAG: adenylate/guanylate cyclase domain-containing protein, partial [Rhodospirillales bacterium]|nr:adenylate/guanylate cyclase domain-containing protein [Rhodospirillales bacterium]